MSSTAPVKVSRAQTIKLRATDTLKRILRRKKQGPANVEAEDYLQRQLREQQEYASENSASQSNKQPVLNLQPLNEAEEVPPSV